MCRHEKNANSPLLRLSDELTNMIYKYAIGGNEVTPLWPRIINRHLEAKPYNAAIIPSEKN
jgi:hypothetical protein